MQLGNTGRKGRARVDRQGGVGLGVGVDACVLFCSNIIV